ncbi:hypothetical protein MA16_Dca027589 [Dendrobium catenatum]|uniref:Uncharacterized protein n=1 Tax=Dendrobium catenatum TaxID=906689 RepID=A0A2I0VJH9_9ASPA|nr:hypothetical protein MA16_Dca027589 [Dendrobium catenatum]
MPKFQMKNCGITVISPQSELKICDISTGKPREQEIEDAIMESSIYPLAEEAEVVGDRNNRNRSATLKSKKAVPFKQKKTSPVDIRPLKEAEINGNKISK